MTTHPDPDDAPAAPIDEHERRAALQLALAAVEAQVGPVVRIDREIPGTAPGWRLRIDVAGIGPAFLKAADGSPWSEEAVGGEAALLAHLRDRHLPRLLAADPGGPVPWLLQPDLAHCAWPPPWPADLAPVWAALRRLSRLRPPPWLPAVADHDPWADLLAGAAGGTTAWWHPHATALADAARRVSLAGDQLVHGDAGAGNLALDGDRVVVLDWSDAHVGDADLDLVTTAVDAAHASGRRVPPPVADLPGWLALVAGLLLESAARPPWPGPGGAAVRQQQAALARTAVSWAADAIG